jgi:hypothetical protein
VHNLRLEREDLKSIHSRMLAFFVLRPYQKVSCILFLPIVFLRLLVTQNVVPTEKPHFHVDYYEASVFQGRQ